MLELHNELREVYVDPGELHIAREPVIILADLGACIGITFWAEKLRVGALAHPVLPYCPTDLTAEKRLVTGRRYVDFAIRQLAWQIDQLDVPRREVQVKVFGQTEQRSRDRGIGGGRFQDHRVEPRRTPGPANLIPYRDRRGGVAPAGEDHSRGYNCRVSRLAGF